MRRAASASGVGGEGPGSPATSSPSTVAAVVLRRNAAHRGAVNASAAMNATRPMPVAAFA